MRKHLQKVSVTYSNTITSHFIRIVTHFLIDLEFLIVDRSPRLFKDWVKLFDFLDSIVEVCVVE